MKKTLLLIAVFLAMMIPSSAAKINCLNTTLDQLLISGNTCEIADKVFSNFSYSGDVTASNVVVQAQTNNATVPSVSLNFTPIGTAWTAMSNLSWTTTIDSAMCPTCTFAALKDQVFTYAGNATSATVSHPGATPSPLVLTIPPDANATGSASILGLTAINTTWSQNSGQLTQLQTSFSQSSVPEPATFALLGGGLVAVALYRRKKA